MALIHTSYISRLLYNLKYILDYYNYTMYLCNIMIWSLLLLLWYDHYYGYYGMIITMVTMVWSLLLLLWYDHSIEHINIIIRMYLYIITQQII